MASGSPSDTATDPHRPSDHIDAEPEDRGATLPKLSGVGWARFVWRLLTSMRTALVLLLLLALAAIPGSLVPQRSSDPNGVVAFAQRDPELFRILDAFGLFSTFSSPWFSAIYILLFLSLIGCILPRTKHHLEALRARPPKTPARLGRLVGYQAVDTAADPVTIVDEAERLLKSQGYRTERYGTSVSAERGYLRETGNLVFHSALVGILVAVGIGGGLGYTGQRILIEGEPFTNVLADYDSFSSGPFVNRDAPLEDFSIRLDEFEAEYGFGETGWHPLDYDARMSVREGDSEWSERVLKVNSPLEIAGTQTYLLGNGFAPIVTVRNPDGVVVFDDPVPFLPQDANLTSIGVLKVPDGLPDQIGLRGFFYPDPYALESGALTSFAPEPTENALLSLLVYRGDLGLDEGVPVNVYALDTEDLEEIVGREDAIALAVGESAQLPDGLGSIEFTGFVRYVSVDVHRDPSQGWVLGFALAAVAGLLISLFIPRRRLWVKAADGRIEYAGLARGEDPTLPDAVADLAKRSAAETPGRSSTARPELNSTSAIRGSGGVTVVDRVSTGGSTPGAGRFERIGLALAVVGWVVHVAAVILRGVAGERVPWANLFEFALTGTAIIMGVFLGAQLWKDLRFLGAYVTGIVVLLLTLATVNFYVDVVPLPPPLQSAWLVIHVLVAILGTGFFALGAGLSIVQLLQQRREAGKLSRGGFLRTLPGSEALEALAYRVNVVGFVFWTFTLICGAIWAERAWGRYWGWDTKEVWTFVIWVVFAGYIHARATRGWRGSRSAVLAIIGFVAVIFNFTIVNIFFQGLHAYSGL